MEEEIKQMKKKHDLIIIFTLVIVSICVVAAYIFFMQKVNTEFILLGDEHIFLEVGNEYVEEGYIAVSNNRNVNNKVKIKYNLNTEVLGDYDIEYNLKINYLDVNRTLLRKISVIDKTNPEIKIDGKKSVTAYIGDKFKYPTYKAFDNYDGDITDKVKVDSNIDLNKVGRYEINYKVSDSSGNESTDKLIVSVEKKKNPYVVVSISNQTLKYYEYDKLVLTSNVVTGINGKTPRGIFKVQDKETNIILKGADYESFVNYWIGFYRGAFGFHDASWRSSFGGNIYQYAGSHGCVNMPYSKVRQLYNMIDIGTPVYIKS